MSIKAIHCGKLIDGTGNPFQENITILIEGKIIKKVGKTQNIKIPKNSKIIDVSKKTVVPGLIDSHIHFLAMGYRLGHYQVGHMKSIEEIVTGLETYIQLNNISEGKWIQGRGWDDQNLVEKRYPNRYDLDITSPKNPVALTRICGHMIVLNSKALEICNISKDTPNPQGGIIDKDDQKESTGVLRDARNLVSPHIPPPSYQELRQGIRDATKLAHSLGVTTIHDASRPNESLPHLSTRPYVDARKERDLNIRAHIMTGLPHERTGDEWLSFGTLKIGIDGSMGAETALLFEPYIKDPNSRGVYVGDSQRDTAWINEANEIGGQVAIHAIGDKAINEAINLIEKTVDELDEDLRFRIEHFEYPIDEDIKRSKRIGIIASMQPNFVGEWGWPGGMYETRLGKERLARSNPFKHLIRKGFHVAFGSDGMPFHAVYGIWSAVNHPNPEHRITVEEAIRCYTYEGAYATKEESIKGIIKPGKLADITILSTDITLPEFSLTTNNPEIIAQKIQEIKNTKVHMTIQNGEIVYKN
jgi:predicted amidohydrolase YtcJ